LHWKRHESFASVAEGAALCNGHEQFSRRSAPYCARWSQRRNRAARYLCSELDLEGRNALRCVILPGSKKKLPSLDPDRRIQN
jgi:hypothetical protein